MIVIKILIVFQNFPTIATLYFSFVTGIQPLLHCFVPLVKHWQMVQIF